MIDKDEYPQTAEIEARCVHMLADLWNSPDAANTHGLLDDGLERSGMLGGLALNGAGASEQQAAGKPPTGRTSSAARCRSAGTSSRATSTSSMREIPLEGDRLIMTPEEALIERVDENTIGVVPTLGVTFTCHTSRCRSRDRARPAASRRPASTFRSTSTAASGGFIAPFFEPDLVWDFRLPRVKSINASGHKFGLAPLGVGWIIWREAADLPED